MLGLSTGIDYGVFILSRHRSQLLAGKPMPDPDIEGTQLEKRLAERRIPAGTPGSGGS
jgi:uncharacterized membrane protein YdfJ with MMPL/SSD domain